MHAIRVEAMTEGQYPDNILDSISENPNLRKLYQSLERELGKDEALKAIKVLMEEKVIKVLPEEGK
jgi:hypothetical protein